jgi:hypothetical protein
VHFLPSLQAFLREHGRIYTLRAYKRSGSLTVVPNVGRCSVRIVKRVVTINDLKPFVDMSGLPSVELWWIKANDLSGYGPKVLYEVTVNES